MERLANELHDHFLVQREMLHTSCTLYDTGHRWEGARIATTTCTLVHDGGKKFTSILTQVGARKGFVSCTSAVSVTPDQLAKITVFTPLLRLHRYNDNRRSEFHPICLSSELDGKKAIPVRLLPIDEWWNNEIIFKSQGFNLTRKDLSMALRNQDGGSHFDEKLENPKLIAARTPVVFLNSDPDKLPMIQYGLELATMRQIGWELLHALQNYEAHRPSASAEM